MEIYGVQFLCNLGIDFTQTTQKTEPSASIIIVGKCTPQLNLRAEEPPPTTANCVGSRRSFYSKISDGSGGKMADGVKGDKCSLRLALALIKADLGLPPIASGFFATGGCDWRQIPPSRADPPPLCAGGHGERNIAGMTA